MLESNAGGIIKSSSVLMIGAGGIGCELLKNLALSGFQSITIIDLDTIDVSNLNRQFLFQKLHVGKPKALVAKESVLRFCPETNIEAIHDTIMNPTYNADYFSQFTLVLNALDNKAARNHVNRLCLAANVPLIESGTAGYLGQVTVIKKGLTECYECQPKPSQKSYPGCTIRNTPSEPVHCIVWAKHLFNQLFGEHDDDNEVSPDTEDPELAGDAGALAMENKTDEVTRKATREWAKEIDYDIGKLFMKFFNSDVNYLLSMQKLWQKRKPPIPLCWNNVNHTITGDSMKHNSLPDKRIWSLYECGKIFGKCVNVLKERCKNSEDILVWDKDDDVAMDFVASTANIRSHIFQIQMKSRFDIKSISGNIIPAIATTNAIIAGLMVVEALKILTGKLDYCRTVYLSKQVKTKNRLFVPCKLEKPNPKCYVCTPKPEIIVHCNVDSVTIKQLEEKLFKEKLGMVAPDVEIDDGKGTILISSEEGETEQNMGKRLSEFNIGNGTRLKADDFQQNFELVVMIRLKVDIELPTLFLFEGELPVAKAIVEEEKPESFPENGTSMEPRKRKLSEAESDEPRIKKAKAIEKTCADRNDEVIIL